MREIGCRRESFDGVTNFNYGRTLTLPIAKIGAKLHPDFAGRRHLE
jgi:hypothetical protein